MPLSKLVPRRLARLVRRAKMSPDGKAFVKKWDELYDYPLPLDRYIELIRNSGERAVQEGIKNSRHSPGLLQWLLCCFTRGHDPREQVEIIRLLLEICPEAAGAPVPSYADPNKSLVYPLHEACWKCNKPNEVIELLLKKSTAGLDRMAVVHMGIVEWYTPEVAGTPLHYYLFWGKRDVAIVKRLVEACPEALTMKDMKTLGLTPLHTILRAPSKPDLEVVKFLVEYNASLLQERDAFGRYPIHTALYNQYITVEVIEVLLESSSTNVWEMRDHYGYLPMHYLLQNGAIEETVAIDIVHLFQRMAPNEAFYQEANHRDWTPIQVAASSGHGANFCKLLVELAPGCERIPGAIGYVPLYGARHIDTVRYLVGLYPESIYLQIHGITPFCYAVRRLEGKYKVDIIRYFLELDPSFASASAMIFPLHIACTRWDDGTETWKRAEVVKTLFDFNPSAILISDADGSLPVDLAKDALAKEEEEGCYYEKIISFLETQHPFIVDASNSDALNTPDANGMLLLHRALLEKNISLGTVKMIVNGTNHEAAVRGPNPLHLACANCAADIIQYLSGIYPSLVNGVDDEGCNILHIACKGGNLQAVQYLLEQHAPMISQTNIMNLLPVHLLCYKSDNDDVFGCPDWIKKKVYVGLVWQLLSACPAAVSSAVART